MRENELMIDKYYNHNGNWNYADHKGIFKFTSSDFYAILESTLDIEDIKPIPLTEELLLKCGFERIFENSNLFLNITNDIYFYWYNDKLNGCVINHYMDSDNQLSELTFDLEILHLHQLQNIFFALTNQELKIIL